MKKIESLTPDQIAKMSEYRDRWIAFGLSTSPADRPMAEQGVRDAYKAAGKKAPKAMVWCGSPISGALTRAIATSIIAKGLGP